MKNANHDRYMVKALVHASRVLEAFQSGGRSTASARRGDAHRIQQGHVFPAALHAASAGLPRRVEENSYRLTSEVRRRRLYRIGYAAQGQDTSFDREVATGLKRAAEREQVELISVDNRYQPKVALRNADYLIRQEVDLVIEFQADEVVAPAIAAKYLEAGIPFIAIDIPHPGATYFGANNYQAGLMGGHHLARWAKRHWNGEADEVLTIELHRVAAESAHARLRDGTDGGDADAGAVPDDSHRRRRAVSDYARARAEAPAGIARQTHSGGRGQQFERVGGR